MKDFLLFFIFVAARGLILAQDTTLIREVEIVNDILWSRDSLPFVPTLSKKKIELIQAEDIGQLLQLFAGAQVKSYGGLGGLKTVSIRGLGAQHTSFVVNGVVSPSDQTGQVNFGAVQTDNIEQVSINYSDLELLPASALSMGSVISMESFEGQFSEKKHSFRLSQKYGSFAQFDTYAAYKKGDEKERYFIAASGKYRSSSGRYPFELQNGSSPYLGVRENNHYQDFYLNVGGGIRFRKGGRLKVSFQKYWIKQELPGPVVLYMPAANQDLVQKNDYLQFNYDLKLKKNGQVKVFGFYKNALLSYTDSNFLNATNLLQASYQLRMLDLGVNMRQSLGKSLVLSVAGEGQLTGLKSSEYAQNTPARAHFFVVPNLRMGFAKFLSLEVQASVQAIMYNQEKQRAIYTANPFLQLKTKALFNKRLWAYISFRNSFRMPSFNELYYNKIGNLDLKPEKANQFTAGIEFSTQSNQFAHLLRCNGYASRVNDKIIAVPTMNLFQWTIQNLGRVDILGVDINYTLAWKIRKQHTIDVGLTYNFQSARDMTAESSPTFKHQIPYMPMNSGNFDFTYLFKTYSVRLGVFANDKRYSLGENIEANEVKGFMVADISLHAFWIMKEKSKLRVSFAAKNVFNASYAIIRNYVMPGRNYLISITYAFN